MPAPKTKTSTSNKRSEGARKGWETRRRNAALKALLQAGAAANENVEGEEVTEVTRDMLIPIIVLPPPLPETIQVTDDMIVQDLNKLPPPLPRACSALHRRALRVAFGAQ